MGPLSPAASRAAAAACGCGASSTTGSASVKGASSACCGRRASDQSTEACAGCYTDSTSAAICSSGYPGAQHSYLLASRLLMLRHCDGVTSAAGYAASDSILAVQGTPGLQISLRQPTEAGLHIQLGNAQPAAAEPQASAQPKKAASAEPSAAPTVLHAAETQAAAAVQQDLGADAGFAAAPHPAEPAAGTSSEGTSLPELSSGWTRLAEDVVAELGAAERPRCSPKLACQLAAAFCAPVEQVQECSPAAVSLHRVDAQPSQLCRQLSWLTSRQSFSGACACRAAHPSQSSQAPATAVATLTQPVPAQPGLQITRQPGPELSELLPATARPHADVQPETELTAATPAAEHSSAAAPTARQPQALRAQPSFPSAQQQGSPSQAAHSEVVQPSSPAAPLGSDAPAGAVSGLHMDSSWAALAEAVLAELQAAQTPRCCPTLVLSSPWPLLLQSHSTSQRCLTRSCASFKHRGDVHMVSNDSNATGCVADTLSAHRGPSGAAVPARVLIFNIAPSTADRERLLPYSELQNLLAAARHSNVPAAG